MSVLGLFVSRTDLNQAAGFIQSGTDVTSAIGGVAESFGMRLDDYFDVNFIIPTEVTAEVWLGFRNDGIEMTYGWERFITVYDASDNVVCYVDGNGGLDNGLGYFRVGVTGDGTNTMAGNISLSGKIDFQFDFANGAIYVYQNGTEILSLTGQDMTNSALNSGIKRVYAHFRNEATFNNLAGEVILADEDTKKLYVDEFTLTADGDYAEWDGTYADVVGTGLSYSSVLRTEDAELRHSFVTGGHNATYDSAAYEPVALVTSLNVRHIEEGNVNLFTRNNSVNADASDIVLTNANNGFQNIEHTDPNTGLGWASYAAMTGAQVGLRSRTS